MNKAHTRTIELIGEEGFARLNSACIAVIGLGGVGGNAAEALLRSGIGRLDIYDGDTVDESNLNRQLFATHEAIGTPKAQAAQRRLQAVMQGVQVNAYSEYVNKSNIDKLVGKGYTYIIDAIDSMADKVDIIAAAHNSGTPIISATGAGNRMHPEMLRSADIYDTQGDPLCRILRQQLRKLGIAAHKVVYSTEPPLKKAVPPASMAFVPNAMGLMLAACAVRDILE